MISHWGRSLYRVILIVRGHNKFVSRLWASEIQKKKKKPTLHSGFKLKLHITKEFCVSVSSEHHLRKLKRKIAYRCVHFVICEYYEITQILSLDPDRLIRIQTNPVQNGIHGVL